MWRLLVIQFYSLFISLQATGVPSSSPTADARSHLLNPTRVVEAVGAKHGYKYEVQFPSSQLKNIVPNRYQLVKKDKDNESSASIGSATLAKYTNQHEAVEDTLHEAASPFGFSQASTASNAYGQNDRYFSPSFSKDYEERRNTEVKGNMFNNNMVMPHLQQNDYSSTKGHRNPDLYLPPETSDNPITNKNEGYIYEKPFNQLTIPIENNNNEYSMSNSQWYPSVSMNDEDDSVEVFPPTEPPRAVWVDVNTLNQKSKPRSESQVFSEAFTKDLLSKTPQQPQEVDFNRFSEDTNNNRVSLPMTKTRQDSSLNSAHAFPSIENHVGYDKPIEMTTPVSPLENSKIMNSDESKSARISSPGIETEIDEISKTSLKVHFAGSVFSAEGLPHQSKAMVFPVDYNFSYDLRGWPEMGHEEMRADSTTRGRYWVGLPDGRVQVVEYTAGPQGFVPSVSYRSRAP